MPKRGTKDYEGFRDTIYKDTKGKRTIGYGFNVDDPVTASMIHKDVAEGKRKLDKKEADAIYEKRMELAKKDARNYIGKKYDSLDDEAREVVDDMSYNLGGPNLSKFKGMKRALENDDYGKAADELTYRDAKSKKEYTPYYLETKDRAKEHVERLKRAKQRKEIGDEMVRQLP